MNTTAFTASARIALLRQAERMQLQLQSPALLCVLSETLAESGEAREAANAFRRAYLQEPDTCTDALARIGSEDARKLRAYSRSLIDNGVAYSPVIAALAVLKRV